MGKLASFADIITMVLTIMMCIGAVRKWRKSEKPLFYYIFIFFYVVPIFVDYIFAFPDYTYSSNLYGFEVSHRDPMTRVLYDGLVLLVQWLLLNVKIQTEKPTILTNENKYFKRITAFLYVGLLAAPVLTILFGDNKAILYTFMWRENEMARGGYLPIAEEFSYVGICCAVVLFFWKSHKGRLFRKATSVLFAYVNICIEGKRSITFFIFLVVFVVMLPGILESSMSVRKRNRRIAGLLLLVGIFMTIMVLFTIKVKTESRGYAGFDSVYTTIRIDFFRDDRVRMAIYAFLYPQNMTILNYPGQTLIPAVLNFFPLDYAFGFIGIHPVSYTAYISAALARNVMVSQADAFMTPAIFAELISNFHILGVVFFVAATLWFAKLVKKYPYPINVFIIISYIVLQMYSISYMAFLLETTFIMCFLSRKYMRK